MSVKRSKNWLSQQRVEVSDLKQIESGVNFDFDSLAGLAWSGKAPLVFKGLTLNVGNAIGNPATAITLKVASSIIFHYLASESGTVFTFDDTETDQILSTTNSNVSGGFVSGTNYVGLDLYRIPDAATSDVVKFLNKDTDLETSQIVPLARILKYRIIISGVPFSRQASVLPIAKVVVSNGNVVSITDSRNMMFRLGSGGDLPNQASTFSWGSRAENGVTLTSNTGLNPFTSEDKNINSLKQWSDAVMTSLWELRGGDAWFSPVNRDNVKLSYSSSILANGDNLWFVNQALGPSGANVSKIGTTVTVDLSTVGTWGNVNPFALGSVVPIVANPADIANFTSGNFIVTGSTPTTFSYVDPVSSPGAPVSPANPLSVGDCLIWKGLQLIYENSGSVNKYNNTIADGAVPFASGEAIYVDLDRSANTTVTAQKSTIYSVGYSALPGRRIILAWKTALGVFSKDRSYFVGKTFTAATTTALGLVKLNNTPGSVPFPVVPSIMSNGQVEVVATGGNSPAFKGTGNGTGAGFEGIGGAGNGPGLKGTGSGSGFGLYAIGGGGGGGGAKLQPGVGSDVAADATSGRIISLADPSSGNDAVNKSYSDNQFVPVNYLINGNFDWWQRGTSFTPASGVRTKIADRWTFNSAAANLSTITSVASTSIPNTPSFAYSALQHQRPAGDAALTVRELIQEIDRYHVRLLRGRKARISFWTHGGADFSGVLNISIIAGTGSETQNYTVYTGSTTVLASTDTGTLATGGTGWRHLSLVTDVVFPHDATTAAVIFSHAPAGVAGANDLYKITGVMLTRETDSAGLHSAGIPGDNYIYAGGSYLGDRELCLKYYETSWDTGSNAGQANAHITTAVGGTWNSGYTLPLGSHPRFRVSKWQNATVTIYDCSTFTAGKMDEIGSNPLAPSPKTVNVSVSDNITGFFVKSNSNGYSWVAGQVAFHWTADAEI